MDIRELIPLRLQAFQTITQGSNLRGKLRMLLLRLSLLTDFVLNPVGEERG
jgi:hypothetical protein